MVPRPKRTSPQKTHPSKTKRKEASDLNPTPSPSAHVALELIQDRPRAATRKLQPAHVLELAESIAKVELLTSDRSGGKVGMPSPKKLSAAKRPKPATQRVGSTDSGWALSPEGSPDIEEEEALLGLYRDMRDRAAKTIQHHHDAEDAVHEAVLALLGERGSAIRSRTAYMVAVINNYMRAEFRRRSRLTEYAPQVLLRLATHVYCPSQPGCAATHANLALLSDFRASLSESGRALFDALCKESTIRGAARHCACSAKVVRQFRDGLSRRFSRFCSKRTPPRTL